ncbi:MAG: ribosome assembly RNA-binding protein YhbY [Candidatus Hydrogenedentes bacterium]|nr:ribosome assembly RNA-binding protein YhbY [Candidatus Hydrogenedentota bacterium]
MKGSDRQYLKSLAHGLKPAVYIGKGGLTDAVVRAAESSLNAHELLKVKFNGLKDEKQEIAEAIAARTESALVGIIGNIATFYRPNPDEEKRQIVLPKS